MTSASWFAIVGFGVGVPVAWMSARLAREDEDGSEEERGLTIALGSLWIASMVSILVGGVMGFVNRSLALWVLIPGLAVRLGFWAGVHISGLIRRVRHAK